MWMKIEDGSSRSRQPIIQFRRAKRRPFLSSFPLSEKHTKAAESLRFIIEEETFHVVLAEILVPNLTSVLQEYFRLMNEIGNDSIVSALECIIDAFPEQMVPHAAALASQLAAVFQRSPSLSPSVFSAPRPRTPGAGRLWGRGWV